MVEKYKNRRRFGGVRVIKIMGKWLNGILRSGNF
jgi:hypothetical protein